MKIGVLGRVAAWDDDGSEIAVRPQFIARLSIFPGDFDHAAAIAVGGAEPVP